jgi:hypothetical protein
MLPPRRSGRLIRSMFRRSTTQHEFVNQTQPYLSSKANISSSTRHIIPFHNQTANMSVIAVAGGTGKVGRAIVEALVAEGKHKTFILSREVRRSHQLHSSSN